MRVIRSPFSPLIPPMSTIAFSFPVISLTYPIPIHPIAYFLPSSVYARVELSVYGRSITGGGVWRTYPRNLTVAFLFFFSPA